MQTVDWLLDGAMGTLLLTLAIGALYARSLYGCISLFLAFGIVMTLVWARLGAPDLALAEAAIGAGLTGALLFNALARSGSRTLKIIPRSQWLLSSTFVVLVFALALRAVWPTLQAEAPLLPLVEQHLPDSGVKHPVTAVLLNFRAWDTFLELAVLLVALLGVRGITPATAAAAPPWRVIQAWSRTLAPVVVVVAGFVLWRGADAPGGAFQAGALLAAGAVLLRLNQLLPPLSWSRWPLRFTVQVGLLAFTAVAIGTALLAGGWLHLPPAYAKVVILLIEVPATLAIAATLTLLVVGEPDELQA